jgi:peroxiredoxin
MKKSLLLLALISISMGHLTCAQTNKYPLSPCRRTYYQDNGKKPDDQRQAELKQCIIGKDFPPFSVTAITGKKYTEADLRGKVVLVTSWFIACPGCTAERPVLEALNKKYKDREFILLSFAADTAERLTTFLAEHPVSYEIIPSADELITFDMQTSYAYPTNLVVSKEGKIVEFLIGTPTDEKGLEATKANFTAIIDRELAR